jgi:hypothetical protein
MFNNLGGRGASADGDFDFLPKPRLPKRVTFLTSLILALRAPAVPGGEAEQGRDVPSRYDDGQRWWRWKMQHQP